MEAEETEGRQAGDAEAGAVTRGGAIGIVGASAANS